MSNRIGLSIRNWLSKGHWRVVQSPRSNVQGWSQEISTTLDIIHWTIFRLYDSADALADRYVFNNFHDVGIALWKRFINT